MCREDLGGRSKEGCKEDLRGAGRGVGMGGSIIQSVPLEGTGYCSAPTPGRLSQRLYTHSAARRASVWRLACSNMLA